MSAGGDTRRRARAKDGGEPPPAPSRASLHETALSYLSRTAATAATVRRALDRKVTTWARRAVRGCEGEADTIEAEVARCREDIEQIVARLGEVGVVNDAAFAEARARSLSLSGRSRRAIAAHLAAKGVDGETARAAAPRDADVELGAALAFARKRKIGPFAADESNLDRDERRKAESKALAAMARAGFDWNVCERAFRMDRQQAEERLDRHRRER